MTPLTTTEKQRNRRRRLNEAAQAMGYPTWGRFETALLAEKIKIAVVARTEEWEHYNCRCQVKPIQR